MRRIMLKLFFCIGMISNSYAQTYVSKHFTIEKLCEGVYAAIAKTGGYSICNAGIIDLGGSTLIFDPFMTPEAALELKVCAKKLTGNDVKYVINSHFHNDHVGGNQVFEKTQIISTQRTHEMMEKILPAEMEENRKTAKNTLENIRKIPAENMTEHQREELRMTTGYFEALASSLDSLKLIFPDKTIIDRLDISGTKRKIRLYAYGKGHTESDLILFLPKEKLVFSGDLLFINHHPWLGDGDIDEWKVDLEKIRQLKPKKIIPGHGPVGETSHLDSLRNYFDTMESLALKYVKEKKNPAEENNIQIPEDFKGWYLSNFFLPNLIYFTRHGSCRHEP